MDMNFFFFKQKTAYEIKECDWSSDVCSSDLISTTSSKLSLVGFILGFLEDPFKSMLFEAWRNQSDRKSVV